VLKLTKKQDTIRITFSLPVHEPPGPVSVVGDFNDWEPGRHTLVRRSNGTRSVAIAVPPGRTVRFRYLGADGHWFDEAEAGHDGENSVVTA
jgi:1,4-alpha-glucan branching enzyme